MEPRRIYLSVVGITGAEIQIKSAVQQGYFGGKSYAATKATVIKIIERAAKQISIESLRADTITALLALFDKLWNTLTRNLGANGNAAYAAILAAKKGALSANNLLTGNVAGEISYEVMDYGVPNREYSREYMKGVARTMRRLAEEKGISPTDPKNRVSLRAEAQLIERQAFHEREIADLKSRGVKLVICSTHADCSDRCFPWQGKIYSLDGTSGTTKSGKPYEPLENATDIWYTTKSGRRYRNGLLGFNCRHKLYPYVDGMQEPRVSKATQQREYAISQRQRQYETAVYKNLSEAAVRKIAQPTIARKYLKEARQIYKEYVRYSEKNGRAYYPAFAELI